MSSLKSRLGLKDNYVFEEIQKLNTNIDNFVTKYPVVATNVSVPPPGATPGATPGTPPGTLSPLSPGSSSSFGPTPGFTPGSPVSTIKSRRSMMASSPYPGAPSTVKKRPTVKVTSTPLTSILSHEKQQEIREKFESINFGAAYDNNKPTKIDFKGSSDGRFYENGVEMRIYKDDLDKNGNVVIDDKGKKVTLAKKVTNGVIHLLGTSSVVQIAELIRNSINSNKKANSIDPDQFEIDMQTYASMFLRILDRPDRPKIIGRPPDKVVLILSGGDRVPVDIRSAIDYVRGIKQLTAQPPPPPPNFLAPSSPPASLLSSLQPPPPPTTATTFTTTTSTSTARSPINLAPVTGMGMTMQQKKQAYKLHQDGSFGNVYVNMGQLLGYHKLIVTSKDGNVLLNQKVDQSFVELVTKRYNTRIAYTPTAVKAFNKLVQLSGLPLHLGSGKYKMLHGDDTNGRILRIVSDPNELMTRLEIAVGQVHAGNDNKSIKNEISEIIDHLLKFGAINKKTHMTVYNKYCLK
jgi:hypothetical protein